MTSELQSQLSSKDDTIRSLQSELASLMVCLLSLSLSLLSPSFFLTHACTYVCTVVEKCHFLQASKEECEQELKTKVCNLKYIHVVLPTHMYSVYIYILYMYSMDQMQCNLQVYSQGKHTYALWQICTCLYTGLYTQFTRVGTCVCLILIGTVRVSSMIVGLGGKLR